MAVGGGVSFSLPKVSRSGVGAAPFIFVNHAPPATALPPPAQPRATLGRSFARVV